MGIEIERKFLVQSEEFKQAATHSIYIKQYYFPSPAEGETLRLRLSDNAAYLTHKGISSADGLTRMEEEHLISMEEANQLLSAPIVGFVEKERYYVPFEGFVWEVDCFKGKLEGLIIAEVELATVIDTPTLPPWVAREVTGDVRYYNAQLCLVDEVPHQT